MNINLANNILTISTNSPSETMLVGKNLARFLKKGEVIGLEGELGSGKTVFAKGIAAGLGIKPKFIRSPTFVLMHNYEGKFPVSHFDCYRLIKGDEIFELGFFDLAKNSITIIEWVNKITSPILLGKELLIIKFQIIGKAQRELKFTSQCGKIVKTFPKLYKSFVSK